MATGWQTPNQGFFFILSSLFGGEMESWNRSMSQRSSLRHRLGSVQSTISEIQLAAPTVDPRADANTIFWDHRPNLLLPPAAGGLVGGPIGGGTRLQHSRSCSWKPPTSENVADLLSRWSFHLQRAGLIQVITSMALLAMRAPLHASITEPSATSLCCDTPWRNDLIEATVTTVPSTTLLTIEQCSQAIVPKWVLDLSEVFMRALPTFICEVPEVSKRIFWDVGSVAGQNHMRMPLANVPATQPSFAPNSAPMPGIGCQ